MAASRKQIQKETDSKKNTHTLTVSVRSSIRPKIMMSVHHRSPLSNEQRGVPAEGGERGGHVLDRHKIRMRTRQLAEENSEQD